jgi:hypothetical protein
MKGHDNPIYTFIWQWQASAQPALVAYVMKGHVFANGTREHSVQGCREYLLHDEGADIHGSAVKQPAPLHFTRVVNPHVAFLVLTRATFLGVLVPHGDRLFLHGIGLWQAHDLASVVYESRANNSVELHLPHR